MATIKTSLGLRIKELRKRVGYTQAQLAELIDMDTTNVCRLETGIQLPKEENLEKIAQVLNVEIKDLFDFGHKKSKEELEAQIITIVKKSSLKELERFYKILQALQE